ncbi:MAG: SIR2 family protein [Elusimicrobia bacterium]|nr:SIR2 family protein [Elusimicrobiota bacterium]
MVQQEFNKHILLTGAGFSCNFGATPLAKEMWSLIFSHKGVQNCPEIRNLMLTGMFTSQSVPPIINERFNYEAIYHEIINCNYEDKVVAIMKEAMSDAYNYIDDIIRKNVITNDYDLRINLIEKFSDKEKESYVFTLNQDLLIERHFKNCGFFIPGFPEDSQYNAQKIFEINRSQELNTKHTYVLPDNEKIIKIENRKNKDTKYFYIKLHGSQNWYDSMGKEAMVIGYEKEMNIEKEPLLIHYYDYFKKVLNQGTAKLLVIGYGFGDKHINEVIADAIVKSKLKLYVISPESADEFILKAENNKYRNMDAGVLKEGLAGYYPYTLSYIILKHSVLYENICKQFFE